MKIAVDTYGCTRNKADGELIKGQIKDSENLEESDIESSDIIILNTCGVKNKTQSKMLNRLKRYREKGKKVLVAGCLPKINQKELEDREAAMTGPDSISKIPKALKELQEGEKPIYLDGEKEEKLNMNKKISKGVTGIIPIAEGCLGNCSYCGVKNARGSLYSYPSEKILEEAKRMIKDGKKQIYLTSQDTGCYGYDQDKKLPELLEELNNIDGDFKIRVGMMNPEHAMEIKEELAREINKDKVYSFLHLPVQSGSDKVLDDMNRNYTSKEFRKLVGYFKKEIEDLNLATDVIVGYPTEDKGNFKETIELLREVKPDVVNISRFYPRPNTEAEDLDQLSSQVLKQRSKKLSNKTREISLERNRTYLNKEKEALVTEEKSRMYIGRLGNYKKIQIKKNPRISLGDEVKVRVTEASARGLKGKLINT